MKSSLLIMILCVLGCSKEQMPEPCMYKGWVHKGYSDKNIFIEQDTTVISTIYASQLRQDEMEIKNILYPVPCTAYDSAGWCLWK